MSSGIDTKHGKLLAEMVVPSSSWNVQPKAIATPKARFQNCSRLSVNIASFLAEGA